MLASGGNSKAYGSRSGIINALNSETDKSSHTQLIVNSNRVKSPGNYHIVGVMDLKVVPLHQILSLI